MSAGKRWNNGKICDAASGSLDVGEEDCSGHKLKKTSPCRQHVGVGQLGERRQRLTDRKEAV